MTKEELVWKFVEGEFAPFSVDPGMKKTVEQLKEKIVARLLEQLQGIELPEDQEEAFAIIRQRRHQKTAASILQTKHPRPPRWQKARILLRPPYPWRSLKRAS